MSALFVDALTTVDFSYLCPRRGLVGESWLVDVELYGELDEQGMVFDFGHVKKEIKRVIDLCADHRLLVPTANAAVAVEKSDAQLIVKLETENDGLITCKAPEQAILPVDVAEITTENLKPVLEKIVIDVLPDNVAQVVLKLYPENIEGAFYHYSHGLKKHAGDCQRIAHGHRSAIQIEIDGQRNAAAETEWAQRWHDIYLITREDLLETFTKDDVSYHRSGYTSQQGAFELTLNAGRCCIMETDSTVELIAHYIAEQISQSHPGKAIKVRAFEGFQKGAIAVID
ncbi:6-pyruvoyl trahydropterin synthase family protein [Endozoicomonadaceae bacterium StTr2]